MQCSGCGAKCTIDRGPLIRAWLILAGTGAVYVGGILWTLIGLKSPPHWLVDHSEIVAAVWFAPFLAANAWMVAQLFRVPLRLVEVGEKPGELGAL